MSFVVVADRSAALGRGTVNASFSLDSRYLNGTGWHCFDAYRGVELAMPAATERTMTVALDASLGGSDPALVRNIAGIGGLLFTRQTVDTDPVLRGYLQRMKKLTARPFSSFTCEGGGHCSGSAWPLYPNCTTEHCAGLTQQMVPIAPTKQHKTAPTAGMVLVPGGEYLFSSRGAEIEGGPGLGVDFQWPWMTEADFRASRFPKPDPAKRLTIPPLFADKYPVTCSQYAEYPNQSKYSPVDTEHWLERWGPPGTRTPPPSMTQQPVTHVSLNDARAYCAYYGKRLPATWEWQWIAGQGADMRAYTWGNEPPANHTCPPHSSGEGVNLTYTGPRDVGALPEDCSSHGVCNCIGNVWQFTSEFQDEHTRSAVLKGGSNYRPTGSVWYLPQIRRLDEHQKYLLFSDGYERAATIGFRCVADAEPQCGALCGELDLDILASSNHSIDLTQAGSIDWLAFVGNQTVRKVARTGASHRLVGFDSAAADSAVNITQFGSALSWADGDEVKLVTGERSALAATSFALTALASAKPSVLTLLLGGVDTAVNVSASLSDGSADVWTAPLFLGSATEQAGLLPITSALRFRFSSKHPGTNLTVRWGRSAGVCDHCHASVDVAARGVGTGAAGPGCVCAASGEQTPPVTGVANLTAEAAQGGNWVTVQMSPKVKNLPVIFSKTAPAGATTLIPLRLAFVANGTVSGNASKIFGGPYGMRVYGNGSPLGIAWADGPSSCPRFSDGAGVGLSSGAFVSRVGEGFVLEAGASAETTRQLTLYGGVDATTGRLEASFTSADDDRTVATPLIVRKVVSTGGSLPFKFVLVFRGSGVLTVRYYCAPEDNDGTCNLTFQGASVRDSDPGRAILQGAALALADA